MAELPPESIGPERPLSRSLQRLAHEFTQSESIGEIYKLSQRWGRSAVLEHLLLLPNPAYQWILGGFQKALREQSDSTGDDLVIGVHFVAIDVTSGWGSQTLAPKVWAAEFLADAAKRCLLPDDT